MTSLATASASASSIYSSKTATTTASKSSIVAMDHRRRAAVIGGSLGGLAAANALHRSGVFEKVDVYERASGPLHEKGSGLGFVQVSAWEALVGKPMMRRNQRASRHQGSFFYGDLWKFLYDSLPEDTVHFGKTINNLTHAGETQQQTGASSPSQAIVVEGVSYDFVVVCDGGFSKSRQYVLKDKVDRFVSPEYAGYVVWRGSVPESDLPIDVIQNIEEGVYKNGIFDTIVLKMAKDNGEDIWTMGTFIATPEDEVSLYWDKKEDGASRHATHTVERSSSSSLAPEKDSLQWLVPHFKAYFGNVPGLVRLIECMLRHGSISPHPQYEFGADRVHRGRVLLLGDAAHMASPRTAVGAHTAILDALAMRQALLMASKTSGNGNISCDLDNVLTIYSEGGIQRAQELFARSREISRQFVPVNGTPFVATQ